MLALKCPCDQLSSSDEEHLVCRNPLIFFTHAAILGNCEHLFQSEPSCQIFLSLRVWWIFLRVKSSLSACNDWSTGIFLLFPPQNLFHRQGELVLTTDFLLCKGICFHSYFQSAAAIPIAMAKWIYFSAWPLGNPYLKLFSRVNIPELLLPSPTKNLWSQMCRCFSFNVYFEDHLLLHFHYPLGFHISWPPYSVLFGPSSHWSVGMWLMEGRAAPHFFL